jgi:hypothetical protein
MATIQNEIFGNLVWNEQYGHWDGEAPFHEEHDAFQLKVESPGPLGTPPSSVQENAFSAVCTRYLELRELAVEQFLSFVNDPEPVYRHDDLIESMSPGLVEVAEDGAIKVSFTDGPTMTIGGHSLVVSVSPDGKVTSYME